MPNNKLSADIFRCYWFELCRGEKHKNRKIAINLIQNFNFPSLNQCYIMINSSLRNSRTESSLTFQPSFISILTLLRLRPLKIISYAVNSSSWSCLFNIISYAPDSSSWFLDFHLTLRMLRTWTFMEITKRKILSRLNGKTKDKY